MGLLGKPTILGNPHLNTKWTMKFHEIHRKSSHYFFLMSETFPKKNTRKLSWPFFSNLSVWDLTPMYGWDATLKEAVRLHVSKANLSRRRSVPPADD